MKKGKTIYDDSSLKEIILKSLSNPINTTIIKIQNQKYKQIKIKSFVEKESVTYCNKCSHKKINLKKESIIWKSPNKKSENKLGMLAKEKQILMYKEVNKDFISIEFIGYIK